MNREEKAAVIEEVAGQISAAEAIFAVDYRGITVAQVAELRTKLRDSNTKLRVVKNSLSERAADQAGASELKPLLVGPTALALVEGDAAAAAKTLSDTNRILRLLDFKGGYMNGSLLSAAEVQSIARLPAREVLHAQLVGTIAAPLTGLVRTLNALIQGLALQLGAIANMDPPALAGGTPPAAEEAPAAAATQEEAPVAPAEEEAPAEEAPAEVAEETVSANDPDPEVAPATSNGSDGATSTDGASDDAPADAS
jgi:large subunit ribosomal protein L10